MPGAETRIVRTVTGDVAPQALGVCYSHEHLLGSPPPALSREDLLLTDEKAAQGELERFSQAGGSALVEMTTPDYGRRAAALRRLSAASGVTIIAATGYNKEKFSAPFLRGATVEELAGRFIGEIVVGMDDTNVRAGVIKASSTLNNISALALKLFEAAALAHQATGAPISTHTEAGTMALEQVALLREAGVSPQHIVIGHVDRKLEWTYLLRLAQTGVYLSFDQISKEKYYPDALRAEFIRRLLQAGHGRQILLSGDMARRTYWQSYSGPQAPGFTFILEQFVPRLRCQGLGQKEVNLLLCANPARALSFRPRGIGFGNHPLQEAPARTRPIAGDKKRVKSNERD